MSDEPEFPGFGEPDARLFKPPERVKALWAHIPAGETVQVDLARVTWDKLFLLLEASINSEAKIIQLALALAADDRASVDKLLAEWSGSLPKRFSDLNYMMADIMTVAVKNRGRE